MWYRNFRLFIHSTNEEKRGLLLVLDTLLFTSPMRSLLTHTRVTASAFSSALASFHMSHTTRINALVNWILCHRDAIHILTHASVSSFIPKKLTTKLPSIFLKKISCQTLFTLDEEERDSQAGPARRTLVPSCLHIYNLYTWCLDSWILLACRSCSSILLLISRFSKNLMLHVRVR